MEANQNQENPVIKTDIEADKPADGMYVETNIDADNMKHPDIHEEDIPGKTDGSEDMPGFSGNELEKPDQASNFIPTVPDEFGSEFSNNDENDNSNQNNDGMRIKTESEPESIGSSGIEEGSEYGESKDSEKNIPDEENPEPDENSWLDIPDEIGEKELGSQYADLIDNAIDQYQKEIQNESDEIDALEDEENDMGQDDNDFDGGWNDWGDFE